MGLQRVAPYLSRSAPRARPAPTRSRVCSACIVRLSMKAPVERSRVSIPSTISKLRVASVAAARAPARPAPPRPRSAQPARRQPRRIEDRLRLDRRGPARTLAERERAHRRGLGPHGLSGRRRGGACGARWLWRPGCAYGIIAVDWHGGAGDSPPRRRLPSSPETPLLAGDSPPQKWLER